VPLSGVTALLEAANAAGSLTVVDVDVSPSVCVDEARLGSLDELTKVAKLATVVKPTRHAAAELLALLAHGDPKKTGDFDAMTAQALTVALVEATGARMVALTAGSEGCALATHQGVSVSCPAPPLGPGGVVDATGAGDAFLGGLVAGMHERIKAGLDAVPNDASGLKNLGKLANAAGAASCQVRHSARCTVNRRLVLRLSCACLAPVLRLSCACLAPVLRLSCACLGRCLAAFPTGRASPR